MSAMRENNLVVLVVEDSLMLIDRILGMLSELGNIKMVIHAANYAESIKMINNIQADIVLLDINLPDKSGIELLKEIKLIYPHLKVIMMTNHATDNYRKLCNHLGADYFFDKSYDFDKIPDAINKLSHQGIYEN